MRNYGSNYGRIRAIASALLCSKWGNYQCRLTLTFRYICLWKHITLPSMKFQHPNIYPFNNIFQKKFSNFKFFFHQFTIVFYYIHFNYHVLFQAGNMMEQIGLEHPFRIENFFNYHTYINLFFIGKKKACFFSRTIFT